MKNLIVEVLEMYFTKSCNMIMILKDWFHQVQSHVE